MLIFSKRKTITRNSIISTVYSSRATLISKNIKNGRYVSRTLLVIHQKRQNIFQELIFKYTYILCVPVVTTCGVYDPDIIINR